jgi:hypothetical protein
MRSALLVFALATVPVTGRADIDPLILHWSENHPAATSSLTDWVKQHPKAARRLFGWSRHHPLRARAFIRWMSDRPSERLDDFLSAHKDWPASDNVLEPNREAMELLIGWAHEHAEAVRDLALDEHGLSWVGIHVFGTLWAKSP